MKLIELLKNHSTLPADVLETLIEQQREIERLRGEISAKPRTGPFEPTRYGPKDFDFETNITFTADSIAEIARGFNERVSQLAHERASS